MEIQSQPTQAKATSVPTANTLTQG